ncbi:MAG TPA: glycosyl hydrolase [Opitutaceae bacterium]|nr:glycosyl hydrolase [Opitutaceae bacterium]
MPTPRLLLALLTLSLLAGVSAKADELSWPEITRENKPWTRWWWPGSAVDKASLTRQLEQIAAAGIGGVEITPIYGAKGYEDRYIDFLSPKWMEMLEHVGREGKRLGLGIDMATGTGWPFGGPWIDEANALARAVLKDGKLTGEPTKMMVKRAAPGDEGLVVDPYSPDALRRYLAPFDKAFASFPRELVRGQFHDSFEYYNGSWTPKFAQVFQEMHGYDVQPFAADLLAKPADVTPANRENLSRIKSDFRDTLAKLHLDYLRTWVEWSHAKGFVVRNQSHGAPGNILDLYANADIAETEVFGSTPFPIPGLRRNADEVRHDQDLPEPLVIRMASSAGHVIGHNLSSSETCTWLRDHWKESLAYAKPEIDRILADGINHIFYHGTVFSPQDAAWPGWLFYASTQFNPQNTLWDDFGALNRYVGRVQSILQRGKPDNDILLYWPLADVWETNEGPLMKQLGVHDVKWLTEQPVGKLAQTLMNRGYSFDYISDAQLQQTRAEGGQLATPGARYKVLVVPAARRMPVATLQRLAQLAANGATVIFQSLPEDVPGFGRLEARRAEFKATLDPLRSRAVVESDILAALATRGVPREAVADTGVSFIRRANATGHDYFFTNLTAKKFDGWVTLGVRAESAILRDALTGHAGLAALQPSEGGKSKVYLQLAPGESLLLETVQKANTAAASARWAYRQSSGTPVALGGNWKIEFLKGGPALPPAIEATALQSWTDLGGDEAKRFGGTARYRIEFDAPAAKADDWLLDLGEVRESARIRLNGREVTTAWSLPFQVRIGEFLKPGRNVLELEVTNLAANRIRDMDQRKVNWKIMREINFVNINYRPFDASGWSLTPSGLLGPVTLTPLKALAL